MDFHLELIAQEFRRRKGRNSRYSLRAFASFLALHPSALSRVLAGKQDLSLKGAMAVVRRLEICGRDKLLFLRSVIDSRRRRELTRVCTSFGLGGGQVLLGLIGFEGFRADPCWLSTILNVSLDEACEAIRFLVDAGLVPSGRVSGPGIETRSVSRA